MLNNILVLQAEDHLRLIEAVNTVNMKHSKRSELMSKYRKIANPPPKNGTINDRDRLKRILKNKK